MKKPGKTMKDIVSVKKPKNSKKKKGKDVSNNSQNKWLVFFIILLALSIIGLIIVAYNGLDRLDAILFNLQNNNYNNSLNNSEEARAFEETLEIKETTRVGDVKITPNSVRWDEGDEYIYPQEGKKWLVIDIAIENLNQYPVIISSLLMFELIDEDDSSRKVVLVADTEGSLDGELGPGRSIRGEIAFAVEEEQAEWELIFDPEVIGQEQAIYNITRNDIE